MNNHECQHNKFIGPVEITEGVQKTIAGHIDTKASISLPATLNNIIENDDGTTTNIYTSSIVFHGQSDYFRLKYVNDGYEPNNSYAEIATADDSNEPIYVRQYRGAQTENGINAFNSITRTLTLLDKDGNTHIPGNLYITGNIYKYNPSDNTRQLVNFSLGPKEAMP